MATKVHYKSYLPEYYTMRDLDKDAGNGWLFCCEDRTLSGKFHSDFTLRPANGYTENDRKVLKQTMLRHEEIFRKQVSELHRLYRIQRNLMDEVKRKGKHEFYLQLNSSDSSPFSIKMLSKDKEKSCHGHGFPSSNVSYSRTTLSGSSDAQVHSKSLNENNSQTGLVLKEDGSSQVVHKLTDSNIQKRHRRILDLQLPADAHIDDEDAEHAKEKIIIKPLSENADPRNINFGFLPEYDVKLPLGYCEDNSSRNEILKSDSHVKTGLQPCNLVDLNEPIREESCEDVLVLSSNFAVQTTHHEGLQEHQNSMRFASEFLGFQKNLVQERYKSEGESVSLGVGRGEERRNHPILKNELGLSSGHVNHFTSNFSNMNARQSSEHVEIKTNYQDFSSILSLKQNKTESWFREKPSQSIEPSDSSSIVNTKYFGPTLPTVSGPFSVLHQTENPRSASSPFSNSISHTPAAVKALPCFSESTMEIRSRSSSTSSQNFGNACDKWPCNHGPRSIVSKGGETYFYPNGIHRSFRSESSASSHVHLPSATFDNSNHRNGVSSSFEKPEDHGPPKCLKRLPITNVKTANDMDLDLAAPRGFQTENALEQKKITDLQGKRESIPGGLSQLRTKSPCSEQLNANNVVCQGELGAVQGYSPLMLTYPTTCEFDEEKDREGIPSLDVLPLLSKAKGKIVQQNEASVPSNSKRILGFPLSPRTQYSPALDVRNRGKEKFLHTGTSNRGKLLDVEEQIHTEMDLEKGVGKCSIFSTGRISFNCSTRSMDQPKSSEHSSKDEVKLPSLLTVQFTTPRIVSGIDLEAPITCMSEDQMLSAESAIDLNRLHVSPAELEGKIDIPQAKEIGDETIVRLAAETIHTMSLDKHVHPEADAGYALPPASNDNLNWLANVVISNSDDQEVSRGKGQESSDVAGMDYFEYMTLNLEEVRVDEFCSNPLEISDPKDEETGVAHLLLTKPRRGPARRRRQRRDFQRDILPGLASLSRHEVTEDMQVIEVLMRAVGESWEAGGSRKNSGRSRSHARPRGRGRRRGTPAAAASAAVVETPLDPHPSQASNDTEARIRGRSILGWGRTTRRCWRQRCSSGNILDPTPNLKATNSFVLPG